MKLLEIKNNLVKLSYSENENPVLGRFLVLASNEKSYVAQFVNLKSDNANRFAIARLLFTFTTDGVVDNYDGSIPNINCELSFLPSDELLDLLPVETAVKFGVLAQQSEVLNLDISIFEKNFTVFVERDTDKSTFISNCTRQLFQMKEKSVIVDNANLFEDYPKIVFTSDFKLPLNSEMIDYLFEYELVEVDTTTKAIIQDIFYAVQQYIKSLDFEFLPIDHFVDVVANQYKETQMPELALLKNKLLKYKDSNIFANTKEEVLAFNKKLSEKNCSIIDVKNVNESLQKEVIMFIHKTLEKLDKYVYFFVPLTDENSDKKLIKQLINHNHVFTTILVNNSYKYAHELKAHAENIILFSPQALQHDFAAYNTFLNKLNLGECIAYGKLTQGIPFIIDMTDLDLPLTKDDVLGDRYQFVPVTENVKLVDSDGVEFDGVFRNINDEELIETEEEAIPQAPAIPEIPEPNIEVVDEPVVPVIETPQQVITEEIQPPQAEPAPVPVRPAVPQPPVQEFAPNNINIEYPQVEDLPETKPLSPVEPLDERIIEPVANLLAEAEPTIEETYIPPENDTLQIDEEVESDYPVINEELTPSIEEPAFFEEELTEDDLNFIEDSQVVSENDFFSEEPLPQPEENIIEEPYVESPYIEEQPPVVPVYPVEDEQSSEDSDEIDFAQGDSVSHPRYGRGVVEKIIKYGNKTLCSISFENVGRRLLDPSISEFVKL